MRRAFVFGAEKSARHLIGAIVFGCLGGAAAVSCSSPSTAPNHCNAIKGCGQIPLEDAGDDASDATMTPDHNVGTSDASEGGDGNATGDGTTDSPADVSPDVPSEAAHDAGGDVTVDGSGDAPVDVAIDHCVTRCGSGSVCTDTNEDPNNCGTCGNVCGLNGTCSNAQCVCTGGATSCSNKCVDLTQDPNHCGNCNTTCAGGYCSPGDAGGSCRSPALVVQSGGSIEQIATDGSLYVYWTVGGNGGGLYTKAVSGGATTTVEGSLPNPNAVYVKNASVYWANAGSGEIDSMTTYNATHSTPIVNTLVAATDAASPQPVSIAVDSNNIYWTDIGTGVVLEAPRAGGTPVTLAVGQDQPVAITYDATNVYWINLGSGAGAGSVVTQAISPPDGGTPTTLASGQDSPQGIAVDSSYVYWTSDVDPGKVQAISKTSSGSATPVLIADNQSAPYGIVVDSRFVYWTNSGDNTVRRASLPGPDGGSVGSPTTIASGSNVNVPTAMAIDTSGYVYWANFGSAQIMRILTQ
jgi:hypothetical protein